MKNKRPLSLSVWCSKPTVTTSVCSHKLLNTSDTHFQKERRKKDRKEEIERKRKIERKEECKEEGQYRKKGKEKKREGAGQGGNSVQITMGKRDSGWDRDLLVLL